MYKHVYRLLRKLSSPDIAGMLLTNDTKASGEGKQVSPVCPCRWCGKSVQKEPYKIYTPKNETEQSENRENMVPSEAENGDSGRAKREILPVNLYITGS